MPWNAPALVVAARIVSKKKGDNYHRRVREAFLQIAAGDSGRYRVIDGSRDIDEVSQSIVEQVNRHFDLQLAPGGDGTE